MPEEKEKKPKDTKVQSVSTIPWTGDKTQIHEVKLAERKDKKEKSK